MAFLRKKIESTLNGTGFVSFNDKINYEILFPDKYYQVYQCIDINNQ